METVRWFPFSEQRSLLGDVEGPVSFKVYNQGTASTNAQELMRNNALISFFRTKDFSEVYLEMSEGPVRSKFVTQALPQKIRNS